MTPEIQALVTKLEAEAAEWKSGLRTHQWLGTDFCFTSAELLEEAAAALVQQAQETEPKVGKLTRTDIRKLTCFVRVLASYDCAGPPACEPPSTDVATGKPEGGLCSPCEAAEYLREKGLL